MTIATKTKRRLLTALTFILLFSTASLTMAYSYMQKKYADIWEQLGITERNGTNYIESSFFTGWLQFSPRNNFKNIALGDRKAITEDLLKYVKAVTEKADFKTKYQRERMSRKAQVREPRKPKTLEERRQEKIKTANREIGNIEKSIPSQTDPKVKKTLEDMLVKMKKTVADLENPNQPNIQREVDIDQKDYEEKIRKYQADLASWEKEYPEDPTVLIKARLQKLLDDTKDIDYSAKLTEKNKKMIFVNPAYEAKNLNWKFGFRAGKEVTETTRAFATQWLRELNKS